MSRLRSNKVVNQAGSGAPELTYGAVVPGTGTISGAGKVSIGGSITAGSFHGDGSGLSGVGDPSAIKSGSDVKVQAISTGANVTGNLAATGNVTAVDGTFSGNATVQGNLTVNGTTTTIDTAVTSVDSLAVDGNVGITQIQHNLSLPDSSSASDGRLRFGAGNDLQIYHDGNNSYISDSGTGGLILLSDGTLIETKFGGEAFTNVRKKIFCLTLSRQLYKSCNNLLQNDGEAFLVELVQSKFLLVQQHKEMLPTAGDFRYNTTEGKFEGYTTEWGEIGGGGGLTTAAHVANNAVVTLDLTAAQDHKVTATGICTITCTGGTEATSHTIRIINSGSATVGFSTYFLFPSGATPSLPSTDGAINLISFTVNRVGAAGTQLLAGASLNFS